MTRGLGKGRGWGEGGTCERGGEGGAGAYRMFLFCLAPYITSPSERFTSLREGGE